MLHFSLSGFFFWKKACFFGRVSERARVEMLLHIVPVSSNLQHMNDMLSKAHSRLLKMICNWCNLMLYSLTIDSLWWYTHRLHISLFWASEANANTRLLACKHMTMNVNSICLLNDSHCDQHKTIVCNNFHWCRFCISLLHIFFSSFFSHFQIQRYRV